MLFKDAQVNFIFKKQKPAIKLEDYIEKGKETRKKNPIKGTSPLIQRRRRLFMSISARRRRYSCRR